MAKIVIDPISRIEGHLKIEATVENGVVKEAKSSGMMYRGLENILIGRDPRDAARIMQRVCGVCPTSHGLTAAFALDEVYGVNGSTTTGKVRCPATDQLIEWQGQMVWRFHPSTRHFEIFAEGGGNTFSLEIDSHGHVFSGTNNGNTRGMFYPQGSYGKKGWGKHGPLTNPYAFGYFHHMLHEGDKNRFAQAFCIYDGGLYPDEFRGKIVAPNSRSTS